MSSAQPSFLQLLRDLASKHKGASLAVLLAAWLIRRRFSRRALPQFPAVPGSFLVGVLPQLGKNGADLSKRLDEWAVKYGQEGVFEMNVLGTRIPVVCDWDMARKVLALRPDRVRKPGIYKRLGLPRDSGLFFSEGDVWRRERRLMAPTFNARNVDSYAPAVDRIVNTFLSICEEDAAQGSKVNVSKRLARFANEVIMCVGSGQDHNIQRDLDCSIPKDTQTWMYGMMRRIVSPLPFWKLRDLDGMDAAGRRLAEAGQKAMNKMAGSGANTIMEKLRQAEGEKLTTEQMSANLRVLLIAGTDTTSKSLSWAFYFLSRDQDLQAKVAKEAATLPHGQLCPSDLEPAKLIQAMWKETLRHKGPAPSDRLETTEDIELAGRVVPAGSAVAVNYRHILHTAPQLKAVLGEDLALFRPERWIAEDGSIKKIHELDSLPYGYGQRICVGMRLAEFEGQLVIAKVLQRFKLEPWDGPELQERRAFALEPAQDVEITFKPRN